MAALYPTTVGISAKNGRLKQNTAITRMPTTQREWNDFIRELDKWQRDEEGVFVPTFTGFSTDPQTSSTGIIDCLYHVSGKTVSLNLDFGIEGTSDQTYFRITNLPESLKPALLQSGIVGLGIDNGTELTTPILWRVYRKDDPVTTDIDFFPLAASSGGIGNWTASGGKGFSKSIDIMYSLWDATL
jgi:hypothetical protein